MISNAGGGGGNTAQEASSETLSRTPNAGSGGGNPAQEAPRDAPLGYQMRVVVLETLPWNLPGGAMRPQVREMVADTSPRKHLGRRHGNQKIVGTAVGDPKISGHSRRGPEN